jgi:hypothetical protein
VKIRTQVNAIDARKAVDFVITDAVRELQKGGLRIVSDIQNQMARTRPAGRTYPAKGRPNVKHVASAPGQPPAIDTGFYRRGIDFEVGETPRGAQLRVGVREGAMVQAMSLEGGSVRMAARPHFGPALEREIPKLTASMAKGRKRV